MAVIRSIEGLFLWKNLQAALGVGVLTNPAAGPSVFFGVVSFDEVVCNRSVANQLAAKKRQWSRVDPSSILEDLARELPVDHLGKTEIGIDQADKETKCSEDGHGQHDL